MILEQRFRSNVETALSDRGWSKSELARRMGASPQYVGNYLSGRVSPGFAVVERFASALGVDPCDLLAAEKFLTHA